ncbi:hypothetical protein N7493_005198 [Penicillium malachiteum]|uniref:Pheromone-regulated membrane protein n=1 Tax=Penicillium malachiteum TaxID=1324776 RepID=A0AAD6MWB8_9EURO|nr:hypothetical protein N7493_005198 [Penicillium malachiteum]
MYCGGDREKGEVQLEEKWDYVNLDDFKSESCLSSFSYIFLWIMIFVALAVYGVDIFTAVNLLAYGRWSGSVEPAIPFKISRWIFAVCIIVSIVLLVLRWILAIRAIRSGSIVRSYLDPLAAGAQSVRVFGKEGRGWKRFLVFAALTKSKKGAEYVALYTYFAFNSWMNTVFADGPRQVINAITLYSVMKMDLLPGGENTTSSDSSGISQFFNNLKILAEDNTLQAVVLFGMLFTLIIWILSVLKLASAVILYLIFLWHHIPAEDGSLKGYCRRKATTRLKRLVRVKVDKALAKGLQLQDREPSRPGLVTANSKPTLPSINMDKTPTVTTLSRSTTETTLPPYSRANSVRTDQKPTLPNVEFDRKPPLSRTTTQASAISTDSASLTANAAPMGYSPLDRQNPTLPPVPPLPSTVPSRLGSAQSRKTPGPQQFGNEMGRVSPATGYRNLTDPAPQPYRTFTPAADPYASSTTNRGPGIASEGDYDQSHSTARYDPYATVEDVYDHYGDEDLYEEYGAPVTHHDHLAQQIYPSNDEYQTRTYTPASTGLGSRPQDPYNARSHTPASAGAAQMGDGYRSYTPASAGAAQVGEEYQSYNPATALASDDQDGYQGRSYTPASTGVTSHPQNPYQARSYTPANASVSTGTQDPYQSQDSYQSSNPYQARSYTPASTSATPHPQDPYQNRSYTPANADAMAYSQQNATPARSMTPASRDTPSPQTEEQSIQAPARTYTPMGLDSPTYPSTSAYTAFNPSATSQTTEPSMSRIQPPPGYKPFARANTASPSSMNRNGPYEGYSLTRAHTDRF